ncbi:hypothetical protein AMJ80_08780 [bacterium SM23_31]|nr:MAG: hypothetical protein AMJ80_08780 [bacterium SM23_31]
MKTGIHKNSTGFPPQYAGGMTIGVKFKSILLKSIQHFNPVKRDYELLRLYFFTFKYRDMENTQ